MICKLYSKNTNLNDVDRIVELLEEGGIIIYPTDTMYGIGCHALKERAIEQLYRLIGKDPKTNHLSIICKDLSDISTYAKLSDANFKLMKRNLPGPFTFILNPSSRLPKLFKNRKEVGIRVPDHSIVRLLCERLQAPLLNATLPHADDEEWEYVTNPELMNEKYGDRVSCVIDGGIGGLEPSTIVDCTGEEVRIVRQGKGELLL